MTASVATQRPTRYAIWSEQEILDASGQRSHEVVLPQAEPFVFVDGICCIDEIRKRVMTTYRIPEKAFWTAAHFPENPVFPGVLLIEQVAQSALCLLQILAGNLSTNPRVIGVDDAKFIAPAYPGNFLHASAQISECSIFHTLLGQVHRNGKLLFHCSLKVMD